MKLGPQKGLSRDTIDNTFLIFPLTAGKHARSALHVYQSILDRALRTAEGEESMHEWYTSLVWRFKR